MATLKEYPKIEPEQLYDSLKKSEAKMYPKFFKFIPKYCIDDNGQPSFKFTFRPFKAEIDGVTINVIPENIESPRYDEKYSIKKIEATPDNLENIAKRYIFFAGLDKK